MPENNLKNRIQQQAYRIVFWQIGIVIALSFATALVSLKNGMGVLAGGLAYGLPNLLFVWLVFRFVKASQLHIFMAAFFVGEIGKLFLSATIVLLIVKYLPISLSSVLTGFMSAIVAFWITSVWCFTRKVV